VVCGCVVVALFSAPVGRGEPKAARPL